MGKNYEKGSKKFEMVEKPGKMLGERCQCKTAGAKCSEITDELLRNKIYNEEWSMSWP